MLIMSWASLFVSDILKVTTVIVEQLITLMGLIFARTNFRELENFAFREDLFSRMSCFTIFREDLLSRIGYVRIFVNTNFHE